MVIDGVGGIELKAGLYMEQAREKQSKEENAAIRHSGIESSDCWLFLEPFSHSHLHESSGQHL